MQPHFVHLSNVSLQESHYYDYENTNLDSFWPTVSTRTERCMKITDIKGIKLYLPSNPFYKCSPEERRRKRSEVSTSVCSHVERMAGECQPQMCSQMLERGQIGQPFICSFSLHSQKLSDCFSFVGKDLVSLRRHHVPLIFFPLFLFFSFDQRFRCRHRLLWVIRGSSYKG